jgi:tetratricopeptide (TPR) repeat protein
MPLPNHSSSEHIQIHLMPHKKLNAYIALAVYLVAQVVYLLTVAPTFSFWDCGEFIAVANTLGVPHPPGTPIFTMMGRVFIILFSPFIEDIGLRVNLISTITASLAVMLTYLITVRLIRIYRSTPPDEWSTAEKISAYGAGVVAALTLAFSDSFWFNAVEAEVYASSMFFNTVVVWLMLRWHEYADTETGDKWLLLIAYAFGITLGVHLQALLAFFALALIYYFRRYEFSIKGFAILVVVSSLMFLVIYPGVVQKLPQLMRDTSPLVGVLIVAGLIYAVYYTYQNKMRLANLLSTALLLILIGYSSMTMIMLRSQAKPPINENAPATFEKLFSYLNREQYGDYPLFKRRWSNDPEHQRNYQKYSSDFDFFIKYQVAHLYLRYFGWQFIGRAGDEQDDGVDWSKLLGIPFAIGLFGAIYHFRRNWQMALMVVALLLLTGVFINIYTNPPEPQPRERDYVYVGSFFAFAIWVGIGIDALFETIRESVTDEPKLTLGAIAACAFGLIFINANMLRVNYHSHDRSGNYVPYDYAYNLLMSCEKDAVLFTNGDNDTFPLWCLQEVYGIRQDVRVCNLSLANTDWHVWQLKNEEPRGAKKVKMNIPDRELNSRDFGYAPWKAREIVLPVPDAVKQGEYKSYYENRDRKAPSLSGNYTIVDTIRWVMPPVVQGPSNQGYIRAQDRVVYEVIVNNIWSRPIYFAMTVSESNRIGIDDYLRMDGFAYKVVPIKSEGYGVVDKEIMYDKLMNVFRYTNLNNPSVYFDENTRRLVGNYRNVFLRLASEFVSDPNGTSRIREKDGTVRERSNRDLAIAVLDKTQSDLLNSERESDFRLTQATIRMYASVGAKDKALSLIPQMEKEVQDLMLKNPQDPLPNFYLAQAYRSLGEYQKALPIFQQLASLYPDDQQLKQEVEELKRLASGAQTLDSSTLTKEKLN